MLTQERARGSDATFSCVAIRDRPRGSCSPRKSDQSLVLGHREEEAIFWGAYRSSSPETNWIQELHARQYQHSETANGSNPLPTTIV